MAIPRSESEIVALEKFVIWREENEVNQFHDWISPIDFSIYDAYLTGLESEGRAVFWYPWGHWPYMRSLLDDGFEKEVLLFIAKCLDKVYKLLLSTKHQQFFVIIDSEGITFSKMLYEIKSWKVFEVLKKFVIYYEANFPEILHTAYLINTPTAAMWLWKFVKPFLSDHTLSKIHLYGSSNAETERWKADIFNDLPEHVIPEKYGGSGEMILVTDDKSEFILGLKE